MEIDSKVISEQDNRSYFIADIGLCHNGSVEMAKKLIDAAAEAEVDAVKFQKRTVDELATDDVLDQEDLRFPSFGKTYRQIREHVEFGEKEYSKIFSRAKDKNITCFVTPFDKTAVDFLDSFNVPAYKLASHSLTDIPLIEYVAKQGKPVILSTGMAELSEIDTAVNILQNHNVEYALLHCVSSYPTDITQANLKGMDTLQKRYGCPVGYSGHETDNLLTLAAVARGAKIVERHITLDHNLEGFDHKVALTPDELKRCVEDIRKIEKMLGNGSKKIEDYEWATREKYRRSVAAKTDIKWGEIITEENLVMLNPGTGIPPSEIKNIIGKKAKKDIKRKTLLQKDML